MLDIGSRRKLFVDDWLIDTLQGGARLMLHRPTPAEVVLTHDEPWEGNGCAYFTIFRDGDIYRMYHRGDNYDVSFSDENTRCRRTRNSLVMPKVRMVSGGLSPIWALLSLTDRKKTTLSWRGAMPTVLSTVKVYSPLQGSRPANVPIGALRVTHNFTPFKDPS